MFKKVIFAIGALTLVLCLIPSISLAATARYEVLMVGDEDEWVEELQQSLRSLGFLEAPATGYFGTNTQNAVVRFQQENELSVDGKAGPETRKMILGSDYAAIPDSRAVNNDQSDKESEVAADVGSPSSEEDAAPPEENTENSVIALLPGDKGEAISQLQTRLKALEFYEYSSITGYFGPVTEEAVSKFQRTHGLNVDGIMGAASLKLLYSDNARHYMMYPGDRGQDVLNMQERLRTLGYFYTEPTGYYGEVTQNSVRAFQDKNNLTVDGKAGPNTRSVLYSESAKPDTEKSDTSNDEEHDTKAEPPSTPASDSATGATKFIEVANAQAGKPYAYGSSGPNSFDCSGFVYYVLKNSGVATSRLSSASYATVSNWETIPDINSLSVGDLVFFRSDNSATISHIGIYVGGGSFIHAAPSSGGVAVSNMSYGYYLRNFVTAKRVFDS